MSLLLKVTFLLEKTEGHKVLAHDHLVDELDNVQEGVDVPMDKSDGNDETSDGDSPQITKSQP